MSPLAKFQVLMAGIVAILVLSSTVARLLSRRASTPQKRDVLENLTARVRSWWVMVAIFAVAFLLGVALARDDVQVGHTGAVCVRVVLRAA